MEKTGTGRTAIYIVLEGQDSLNPLDYLASDYVEFLPRVGDELELPEGFYRVTRVRHFFKTLPYHIDIYVECCSEKGLRGRQDV